MTISEYLFLDKDNINEDDALDYTVSSDESIINQVIDALKRDIKIDTTYADITFGQLVIIENALKIQDVKERIVSVLSAFYRPNTEKIYDNTCDELENTQRTLFEGVIFGVCFELFDRVMKDRNSFFYDKFDGIVYSKSNSGSNEEIIETLEMKFCKIFGWYDRQRIISKEMNIPFQDVLDLKAYECMIELAYQAMKYKVESKRMNK